MNARSLWQRKSLLFGWSLACLSLLVGRGWAQTSGNIGYEGAGGKARAEQKERSQRVLTKEDLPPSDSSMYVDADVLMNVKADEYVAVFGVAQEGATVDEANQKMDAVVKGFTASLKALHLRESDIYVDFITQPKVYGYEVSENVAREKLTGFELKKNVSVHYSDPALLDKLMEAAAKEQIYDLVKVDYVVKDIAAVEAKLREEDAAIIKEKVAAYEKLLGTKVKPLPEVIADRPAIYYPSQLYDSYTAAETESVSRPANLSRMTVQQARKERTFFFNALDGNGFDKVVNPVVTEPVVQFTLYLKVKYEVVR